jgi:hypothetical protein
MIGYILTNDEYTQVQGQFYAPYEFFNCVQDINGIWFLFLSTDSKETILNEPTWNWILTLPEGEYIAPPSPFPFNETN